MHNGRPEISPDRPKDFANNEDRRDTLCNDCNHSWLRHSYGDAGSCVSSKYTNNINIYCGCEYFHWRSLESDINDIRLEHINK